MYKAYFKDGKAMFYTRDIEIDGVIYGIRSNSDIERIKRRIVYKKHSEDDDFNLDEEISKITHIEMELEQPTDEQLRIIQSKTFDNTNDMMAFVHDVMNGKNTMSQEEINAMLLLEIARLKVGAESE